MFLIELFHRVLNEEILVAGVFVFTFFGYGVYRAAFNAYAAGTVPQVGAVLEWRGVGALCG